MTIIHTEGPIVVGVTGHRPHKLRVFNQDLHREMVHLASDALEVFDPLPAKVVSGMAPGWDMAVAHAAINLKIPLTAAVPYWGQENPWKPEVKAYYQKLCRMATEVKIISEGKFSIQAMHARDRWVVDQSVYMLALFSGELGGTAYTLQYADEKEVPYYNLWPAWLGVLRSLNYPEGMGNYEKPDPSKKPEEVPS